MFASDKATCENCGYETHPIFGAFVETVTVMTIKWWCIGCIWDREDEQRKARAA